jgi:hypothetical protein
MIGFFEWQFFHGISYHDIGADWVSMGTGLAGRIEEVIPLQGDLESIPFYVNEIAFLTGLKNFSLYGSTHFSPIHHSLTRDSDHKDLTGLKPFFQRKSDDRAGVTSLHDKAQLESTEFVNVGGQIVFAEGVPKQTLDFVGASNEPGRHTKGQSPLPKPDDKIDSLLERSSLAISLIFVSTILTNPKGFKSSRVQGVSVIHENFH